MYRFVCKLAIFVMLAGLLLSCAAPATQPAPAAKAPEKPAQPAAAPTAVPPAAAKGGDLVIAMDGSTEPALLDFQIDPYTSAGLLDSFLTGSLLCRVQGSPIKPYLATGYEIDADNLGYTFKLRKDVKFQDGTPFNAEAVKYNVERVLAPETKSVLAAANLRVMDTVKVVDEYTIAFRVKEPNTVFLNAAGSLPLWSPTAAKKYGLTEFPNHLTGNGPYMFKENVPKDHVTFVRNPDFNWPSQCADYTGQAPLDSITFKWIAEAAVLGGIIKTGQVQVASLPATFAKDYLKDTNYVLVSGFLPGSGQGYVMNTTKAPLDDIKIRKALMQIVDRESVNQMLFNGTYKPSYGPLSPLNPCYNKNIETMYPRDLAKAGALLDEAGWKMNPATKMREKDGKKLTIKWAALSLPEVGEALKAQFKEVGIDLAVEIVAGPVQIDMVTNRSFDLMYQRLQNLDPDYLASMYNSKNAIAGGWAWSGFKDAKLDELLTKAVAQPSVEKACPYYEEAQMIVMENALRMPMFDTPLFWVTTKQVTNFKLGMYGPYFQQYMGLQK